MDHEIFNKNIPTKRLDTYRLSTVQVVYTVDTCASAPLSLTLFLLVVKNLFVYFKGRQYIVFEYALMFVCSGM